MLAPNEPTIPNLQSRCPFPAKLHDSAAAMSESQEWFKGSCVEFAQTSPYDVLLQALDEARVELAISYCFPNTTEERLKILCDLGFILFLLDDFGEIMTKAEWERIKTAAGNVLKSGKVGAQYEGLEGEIVKMIGNWWNRLGPSLSSLYRARLLIAFSDYLEGISLETDHREIGHIHCSQDKYMTHRRSTTMCRPLLELVEFSTGAELPEEVLSDSEFIRMRNAVSDYTSLTNDILSYKREWKDGNNHNLVIIMLKKYNKGPQHAINHVVELAVKAIDTYLDAKGKLPFHSKEVKEHCNALEYIISGSLEWSVHVSVPRYFGYEGRNVI